MTNMRIYWDQILVDASGGDVPDRRSHASSRSSRTCTGAASPPRSTPDGREPYGYDYARVSARVAVEADDRALHARGRRPPAASTRVDDMFVVSRPGDEIALSFDARRCRRCPPA